MGPAPLPPQPAAQPLLQLLQPLPVLHMLHGREGPQQPRRAKQPAVQQLPAQQIPPCLQFGPAAGQLLPALASMGVQGLLRQTGVQYPRSCLSSRNLYSFSSRNNIIMVMLNRMDLRYVQAVLDEDPDVLEFMDGSHPPYTIAAKGQYSDARTSAEEQTEGCLRIVSEMLERLKDLGLYEDAAIILTADHGVSPVDRIPLDRAVQIGQDASDFSTWEVIGTYPITEAFF